MTTAAPAVLLSKTRVDVLFSYFITGGVFSSIFSSLFGSKEMRILILGLDGAGKTTILYRLQVGEVVTTIPSEYIVLILLVHVYVFNLLSPKQKNICKCCMWGSFTIFLC